MKNLRKFLMIVVLLVVAIIVLPIKANAADDTELTDLTGVKIEFVYGDTTHMDPELKISNIPIQNLNDNSGYYAIMHNEKGINVTKVNNNDDNLIITFSKSKLNGQTEILGNFQNNIQTYLEKNGKLYISIFESKLNNGDELKKVLSDYELTRPNLLPLGKRINGYFTNDSTTSILNEATANKSNRKLNIKIGLITDNNILLSIKNGESNCLQKLLDYSKKAQSVYTGQVKLGQSDSITGSMNLVNDAYYYVYMELDDENGKYYPVEDVSLYQATVELGHKDLYDYLDDHFKWNIQSTQNTQNTQTPSTNNNVKTDDSTTATKILPKTGTIATILIILIGILSISTIIFIRKVNKYKGIK